MQIVTLKIKDGYADRVNWLLSHLKDEVEIVEPKNQKNDWREVYSKISAWNIDENEIKLKSWQIEKY